MRICDVMWGSREIFPEEVAFDLQAEINAIFSREVDRAKFPNDSYTMLFSTSPAVLYNQIGQFHTA